MKRKGTIGPLLIVVAMMMFAACASSRQVAKDSHRETRDSIVSSAKDSSHVKVAASDSMVKRTETTQQVSSSSSERDSLDEVIHEHITEQTDAATGNKTTTTDRTIHRKQGSEKNTSYDARLNHQQSQIDKMAKTLDSLQMNTKSNVGTHWAAQDSIYRQEDKNTDEVKREGWNEKARKNAFQIFLLFVVGIMLLIIKRKKDGKGQEKK